MSLVILSSLNDVTCCVTLLEDILASAIVPVKFADARAVKFAPEP